MNNTKPPKELDAIADVVLAYRPRPRSKPAKKRKKMKRLIASQAADKAKNKLQKTEPT
jgi:hypothetical protein